MTAAVLRKKSSCFFLPENRTPGTDDRQGRNGFADQGSGERRENEESREYRDNEERIEMKREWRECTGEKYRGIDRKGRRSNTEDGRRGNRKERKHREQEDRGEKNQKADRKRRQENGSGSGDSVTPLKQRSHTASKRLRKLDCDTTGNRMFHKNRRREFADFGQILSLTLLGPFDSIFNAPRERSTKNTERYRSGHNEAVLKTVCPSGRMGSNPILSAQTFLQQAIEYRIFDSGIFGEIPKWPKGLPWKGSRSLIAARGFKSLFLR